MAKEIKPDEHGFYSMSEIRSTTLLGKIEAEVRNISEAYNNLHYERVLIFKRDYELFKQLLNRLCQRRNQK